MWVVDAGGLGIVVAYSMVAASFLILRKKEPELERPYKVPFGNAVGIAALILSLGLSLLYLPGSPSALIWQEWTIIVGWMALGVVLYLFTTRTTSPSSSTEE